MKDSKLYLIHIQEAVRKIQQYTEGGEGVFLESSQIQDGGVSRRRRIKKNKRLL